MFYMGKVVAEGRIEKLATQISPPCVEEKEQIPGIASAETLEGGEWFKFTQQDSKQCVN